MVKRIEKCNFKFEFKDIYPSIPIINKEMSLDSHNKELINSRRNVFNEIGISLKWKNNEEMVVEDL